MSRVQAVGFLYNDEGKITGIQAKDLLTDEQFEIHADVVINTTGPWSDKLRGLDKTIHLHHKCVQPKGFI